MIRSKIAALRDFVGLLIFLASLCISIQLAWVIEHQRPDEILIRSIVAALVALLLSMVVVWAVRQFLSEQAQDLVRKLSNSLWPGFLLLFTPFHVLSLCRWRNECDYLGDFFIVQFLVLMGAILFATMTKNSFAISYFSEKQPAIGRVIRLFRRHCYFFAFILALAILLFRGWERFIHPEFFAEGGLLYLSGALNYGWESLLRPYDGFLHVFPRLIVLTGLGTVPVQYLAQFTVTACFLVAASTSAVIVRSAYRWIIPSDVARWGICVLLCLAPGLSEMLGNLATMHYLLFMLAAFIVLKDPAHQISLVELAAIAVTVLSTGLTVALIPLALFRVLLKTQYSRKSSGDHSKGGIVLNWPEWVLLLMLVIPSLWAVADILFNPAASGIKTTDVPLEWMDLLKGLANTSVVYFLLLPFAGAVTTKEAMRYISPAFLFLPLALITAKLLYDRWRADRVAAVFVALWLVSMVAIPVMIFILRPRGFEFFLIDRLWGQFSWWMRYNYLVAVPGIVLWFLLLRPNDLSLFSKKASILILIILSSGIFHAQYIFSIGRYTNEELWKEASATLKQSFDTGCPKEFTVKIFPGKTFIYKNRESQGKCP